MMYAQSVEGLLRALAPLSASAKRRFTELGVDPDKVKIEIPQIDLPPPALDFGEPRKN